MVINNSMFKSPQGEAAYMAAYAASLALWPVPYDALDLTTRLGSTHVIASGPQDAPPLVLLHGFGASASEWFANVAELSRSHRTYALDIIGQPGKSLPSRPLQDKSDYVTWLVEVFDALKIERASVAGHSFGAWLTMLFALSAPEKISRMALLAPAASLVPYSTKFFLSTLPIMFFPTRTVIERAFRPFSTPGYVVDPHFGEQMVLGIMHQRRQKAIFATVFSDAELLSIAIPTLLVIGEEEVVCNRVQAIERAQRLMPNIETSLIPHAGHLLIQEQPQAVNERLVRFLLA
jgi:pimeloyl-ACP methyl ester carboxylesterase